MKEALGWILAWTSAYIEPVIEQIALNAKAISANQENCNRMVAASYGSSVRLWSVNDNGRTTREVGECHIRYDIQLTLMLLFCCWSCVP
jgi:hypothetical protein